MVCLSSIHGSEYCPHVNSRNASATEALPVFLSELVPEFIAVILSVTAVLLFGEIIPASILTGLIVIRFVESDSNRFRRAATIENSSDFYAVGLSCIVYLFSNSIPLIFGIGPRHW